MPQKTKINTTNWRIYLDRFAIFTSTKKMTLVQTFPSTASMILQGLNAGVAIAGFIFKT
jgi:hypothetical protein